LNFYLNLLLLYDKFEESVEIFKNMCDKFKNHTVKYSTPNIITLNIIFKGLLKDGTNYDRASELKN
jgi:hypothetical protein